MTENQKLREALQKIVEWGSHDVMLGVDFGSNGVRDFYRRLALEALALPTAALDAQHRALRGIPCPTCSGRGDLGVPLEQTAAPVDERELPPISEEALLFLHYNPNTADVVAWIEAYATAAVLAERQRASLQSGADAVDAKRWRYAMDWGTKDFAVCIRVGRTGVCWEPIKTDGPIDAAIARGKG